VGVSQSWEHQVACHVSPGVLDKLVAKNAERLFRIHWQELMSSCGNPREGDKIRDEIIALYSAPHRHYHVLAHPVKMLEALERLHVVTSEAQVLSFAVIYHDAIYDVEHHEAGMASNEECSAEKARQDIARLGLPERLGKRVGELISHTEHTSPTEDPTAQILVDLDLGILGSSPDDFDRYERQIRKEYAWVPEEIFKTKRSLILRKFLDRLAIYSTKQFQDKYEAQARENLKRSISR
jgi:predicted metal-dependent HD superfamily phosphohydrolase